MFKVGKLVKSKARTNEYPLFLMVINDKAPSETQFNAVVIKDVGHTEKVGSDSNAWNTDNFELTSWKEIKPFLK